MASIKRRFNALETKIKKGAETMLVASRSDLADLSETLAEWREQRDTLKGQLADIDGSDETKVSVGDAIDQLRNLRKAMDGAKKPKLREIIQRVFSHVELFWEPRYPGNGKSYGMFKLARGLVVFRDGIHAEPIEFGRPELGCLDKAEQVAVAVSEIYNGVDPVTARELADHFGRKRADSLFRRLVEAEERGLLGSCFVQVSWAKTQPRAWFPTNASFFARHDPT